MFEDIQKFMQIRRIMEQLQRSHPRFPAFLTAVRAAGIHEGTVIEVKVTEPDGREFITNVRVKEEDLEAVRALGELQREMSNKR